MTITDLRKSYPDLVQQIFSRGFNSGLASARNLASRDNSARNRVFGDPRAEAAELISNANQREPKVAIFRGL